MAVPGMGVSFKEFAKNPIVALLFMALMAIGYLYYDNKSNLTNQVEDLRDEITILKSDYKELNDKFIETIQKINNEN
tara:strand:- start:4927 stop:5157 length:231 start_codon:yes stop_codon:yes gene_type:complete